MNKEIKKNDEKEILSFEKWHKEWEEESKTFKWKYIERPYYVTMRFFENFSPRKIRWILQKIFRGYSDSDLWNLDYAIAKKVLPMLKAYRKMDRVGTPIDVFDEPYKETYSDDDSNKAIKKWNEILDKMIYAFTYILHEDDEKYRSYLGFEYKENNFMPTQESREKVWGKYKEGMNLFAEHFTGLWD